MAFSSGKINVTKQDRCGTVPWSRVRASLSPYGGTYSGTYLECPKKCLRTSLNVLECPKNVLKYPR